MRGEQLGNAVDLLAALDNRLGALVFFSSVVTWSFLAGGGGIRRCPFAAAARRRHDLLILEVGGPGPPEEVSSPSQEGEGAEEVAVSGGQEGVVLLCLTAVKGRARNRRQLGKKRTWRRA